MYLNGASMKYLELLDAECVVVDGWLTQTVARFPFAAIHNPHDKKQDSDSEYSQTTKLKLKLKLKKLTLNRKPKLCQIAFH